MQKLDILCSTYIMRTLPNEDIFHIESFRIFGPPEYSEFCLFKFIKAYAHKLGVGERGNHKQLHPNNKKKKTFLGKKLTPFGQN